MLASQLTFEIPSKTRFLKKDVAAGACVPLRTQMSDGGLPKTIFASSPVPPPQVTLRMVEPKKGRSSQSTNSPRAPSAWMTRMSSLRSATRATDRTHRPCFEQGRWTRIRRCFKHCGTPTLPHVPLRASGQTLPRYFLVFPYPASLSRFVRNSEKEKHMWKGLLLKKNHIQNPFCQTELMTACPVICILTVLKPFNFVKY